MMPALQRAFASRHDRCQTAGKAPLAIGKELQALGPFAAGPLIPSAG